MSGMIGKWGFWGIGEYPPEYNRRIHGPYNPSKYYGKPDIPYGDVKVGELPAWFARRSFHPLSIARALGRAHWHWNLKYVQVRYGTAAPMLQFAVALSFFFYVINYKTIRLHNRAKYH